MGSHFLFFFAKEPPLWCVPTNPLTFLPSSYTESRHHHFMAGMGSGLFILCCRARILISVMNVVRELFKDRLASLKSFFFPSKMSCSMLAAVWSISGGISVICFITTGNNSQRWLRSMGSAPSWKYHLRDLILSSGPGGFSSHHHGFRD